VGIPSPEQMGIPIEVGVKGNAIQRRGYTPRITEIPFRVGEYAPQG